MPQLKSTSGGRDLFIADDDPQWQSLVQSGDYTVAPGQDVSIQDAYGHQTVVGTDTFQAEQARGVQDKVESNEKVVERARRERLKDETSTLGALGRATASGISWGLTDNLFDDETLEADRMHHGTASLVGDVLGIGGSLVYAPEMYLARGLGIGAKAAKGVHELAVAEDMLTAERLAGDLSSNALLAGKAGENAAERSLLRTGAALDDAAATKQALSVADDLAGLDAKALKQAHAEERASLKLQAKAEQEALLEARGPVRAEILDEVKSLHQALETEAPIFKALKGADVQAIDGIKDASAQLAKSYSGLRSTLDNPIRVLENTDLLKGHLQMRQAALETIQAKLPDLRATLGADARAAGLRHVDDALDMTRQQIARIGEVSRATPVSSAKLAELESGISPRLLKIEAAQEALKNAPEVGLMQKGLSAGVFAGATELARMIPGVGAMAPFVGKWASESVGKTFQNLAALKDAAIARTKAAKDKFLNVAKRAPVTTGVQAARTASRILSSASFGEASEAKPAGKTLPDLFRARSAEIRNQTMFDPAGNVVIRPEARAAIAKRLDPIATVNPLLADKLEQLQVRKVEYISATMPRQPDVGGLQIGPDNWKPSDLEIRSWARTIKAVEDPGSVEEDLADGIVTPEAAAAYRAVYPERFAALQRDIFEAAPTLNKTLPMNKKIALSIFTGVPLIPELQPNVLQVLQANFAVEPNAPQPQPNFGALGSAKSLDKPTAAQARE